MHLPALSSQSLAAMKSNIETFKLSAVPKHWLAGSSVELPHGECTITQCLPLCFGLGLWNRLCDLKADVEAAKWYMVGCEESDDMRGMSARRHPGPSTSPRSGTTDDRAIRRGGGL